MIVKRPLFTFAIVNLALVGWSFWFYFAGAAGLRRIIIAGVICAVYLNGLLVILYRGARK